MNNILWSNIYFVSPNRISTAFGKTIMIHDIKENDVISFSKFKQYKNDPMPCSICSDTICQNITYYYFQNKDLFDGKFPEVKSFDQSVKSIPITFDDKTIDLCSYGACTLHSFPGYNSYYVIADPVEMLNNVDIIYEIYKLDSAIIIRNNRDLTETCFDLNTRAIIYNAVLEEVQETADQFYIFKQKLRYISLTRYDEEKVSLKSIYVYNDDGSLDHNRLITNKDGIISEKIYTDMLYVPYVITTNGIVASTNNLFEKVDKSSDVGVYNELLKTNPSMLFVNYLEIEE